MHHTSLQNQIIFILEGDNVSVHRSQGKEQHFNTQKSGGGQHFSTQKSGGTKFNTRNGDYRKTPLHPKS